jgi:hypothetical protein
MCRREWLLRLLLRGAVPEPLPTLQSGGPPVRVGRLPESGCGVCRAWCQVLVPSVFTAPLTFPVPIIRAVAFGLRPFSPVVGVSSAGTLLVSPVVLLFSDAP